MQDEAEALSPRVEDGRRQGLARRHTEPQRRQIARLGVGDLEEPRVHGRDGEEHGRALGLDQLEDSGRIEPLGYQQRGCPDPLGEVERVAEAEGEVHLRGRERQVVGSQAEDPDADQIGGGHEVAMRVDRGLGQAGRARGVAPVHHVLVDRCGRRQVARGLGHEAGKLGGGEHRAKPGARGADAADGLGDCRLGDDDPGAAVLEQEGILLAPHERVDRNGDGAELCRRPERRHERRGVVEGEHDALLDAESEPGQGVTGTIRRLGDVGAGDRPAVMTEGRALAAPFSHVTVHEEGRGVEAHGAIVLHGPWHDTARRADARRRSTRRAANRGSRLDSPKPSPQRRNQCSYVISGRSRPQVGRGLAGARAGIVLAGVPPSTSTRVAWSVPVIPKYPSTVAAPPIGTDAGATGNPS